MSSANLTKNWILFQAKKLKVKDFIQHYKNDENEQLQIIIDFIEDWQKGIPYILQKTSGSTGQPKTIKIKKSQIEASARATLNTLGIQPGDNAMLCINPAYIGGKMMIARALIGQLNLCIAPISGNPLRNFNPDQPIQFFSFVPYQLEKILEESPEKSSFLDNSKAIILGGAPVSGILAEKIKSNFSRTKVYSTYGMTETVSHVALKLINTKKEEPFRALDSIEFSADDRSCLVIHARQISGQDKLVTNDVVDLISPTEFHWLGRYDFVINSGGVKIHPEQVEKEIAALFESAQIENRFFVFGKPDEKLGESLNLMVEGKVDKKQIYSLLKRNLKAYHSPKEIDSIDQFVETESGKISRTKTIENKKQLRS